MRKQTIAEHIQELTKEVNKKTGFRYPSFLIERLRKDAINLRQLYEHQCNGCTREKFPNESWEDYDKSRESQMVYVERRVKLLEKRIADTCKEHDLKYYIQTDPRGCALYLGTESDNSYNTEGVAIY